MFLFILMRSACSLAHSEAKFSDFVQVVTVFSYYHANFKLGMPCLLCIMGILRGGGKQVILVLRQMVQYRFGSAALMCTALEHDNRSKSVIF
jgi:hypothetical protein